MSYRAFKHLLGETSLERKCRFLFGEFILLLIAGSFLLYAWQTEHLAYEQITVTCRLLVVQIVDRQLATGCKPAGKSSHPEPDEKRTAQALDEFREQWEERWPVALQDYRFWTIKADASRSDRMPVPDPTSLLKVREFQEHPERQEDNQLMLSQGKNFYYGA